VNMGSIAVTNAFQALGFAMPISFQESIPFSAGNQTSVQLNYTQNFANTFRVRVAPTGVQNVPGTVYNTESGFVNPALAPGAGLADSGTRLLLQVNGVPAGVNVYAAVSSSDGVSASLVSTDNDGVGTEGSFITGAGMFGGTFAPVSVSNGTGTAVWEVVSASAPANLSFQIVLTGMTQAGLGPVTLEGSIAPLSAATAASATAPLPRFAINSLTGFIDLTLLSTSSSATRSTGAQALAALAANPLSVAYRGRPAAAPTADGIPVSAPSPIQAGSSVTLGFSAVNQSAGAVTQVTIQSNVPSLLSVGSCSAPGGSCSNSTNPDGSTSVTAVYPGPVQPGASTSLSYTATACTSCVQNSAATVSTTVNGLNAGQQFVSDADPDDNTSNSSVTVVGTTPQVNVQFATNPPGLTLQIPSGISPISQSGSLNFQAVTPQPGPNGSQYVFSSWSDGSTSAIRTAVPVPLGGGTFTATFIAQYPLQCHRVRIRAHTDCREPSLHAERFGQLGTCGGVCLELDRHLHGVGSDGDTGRGGHVLDHRHSARQLLLRGGGAGYGDLHGRSGLRGHSRRHRRRERGPRPDGDLRHYVRLLDDAVRLLPERDRDARARWPCSSSAVSFTGIISPTLRRLISPTFPRMLSFSSTSRK
jgi:hypothetical protein